VAPILGVETLSDRCAASMREIGETLTTWPQLGSEILLGGATVSAAVRLLILGMPLTSGRYYVDLAALLSDGQAVDRRSLCRPLKNVPCLTKPDAEMRKGRP
jgi:hypothetical protein